MDTNKSSPHLQISHNLSGLLCVDWNWHHPIVTAFHTLCPVELYIQWCGSLHQTHLGSYFEKLFVPALEVNFLKNLPQLVAPWCFQSWYHSHGESFNSNIVSHYNYTYIEQNFWNYYIYIYYKKDTNVGRWKIRYRIWVCSRLMNDHTMQFWLNVFPCQQGHSLKQELERLVMQLSFTIELYHNNSIQ